jgi:hypothetical protein
MTNATQAQVDTPSPAAIAKSLDQTSKLSIEGNPFESLANLNPADQSTETVIEACIILAKSVTDFWRQYGSWLSQLKLRMEVRNGSKGKQLLINGAKLYWHEFLAKYFDVSRRQINRIEKEVTAGTYKPLLLVEGYRVVGQTKDGHAKEGTVTKVHQSAPKVDVDFGDGKEETIAIENVSKAKTLPVGTLRINRLYVDARTHVQFRYTDEGRLVRTKEQPRLKALKEAEAVKAKANLDRIKAKAVEEQLEKENRKAEALRKDLDQIVAAHEKAAKKPRRKRKGSVPAPVQKEKKSPRYISAKCSDAELYGLFNIRATGEVYTKANAVFLNEKAVAVESERLARIYEMKEKVAELEANLAATYKQATVTPVAADEKFDAKIRAERDEGRMARLDAAIDKVIPSKPTVTPAAKPKSPLQRLRAAMRAAKFYAGMMDELFAVQDMGNDYTRLLTLHGGRYPWTPPTKTYSLPPTEEEFQAEWDAAMKEFDEVMAVKAPTVTREDSK